uniref:Adenylyltransferase and sulfurtransferase MOCS3 n=1 Tax=Tetradesmus obliquus TaxID=3088 RepID=A0A383W957_TETOB|eukprot:jgi/Sobl393_1/3253/SZX73773.1
MADVEQLRHENALLREELAKLRAQLATNARKADPGSAPAAAAAAAAAAALPSTHDNSSNGCAAQTVCSTCPIQADAASLQQQSEGAAAEQATASSSSNAHQALHGLSKAQVERYSRQLLLPSFGIAAQGRVCSSSVLIVGCGGLGSPAALYLAAAGVRKLGLVDHDVVELSNMHRQVSHSEQRLGMHKAASTAAAVAALNSSVAVDTHLQGLTPSNAVGIISQYDVVIDASDNAPTRYLINDACVACGVPLVSAAAVGTDGQLTVYNAGGNGPCYRCLFPECPAAANCSRCADAGVLGPVPGVMGVLQAVEAIKLVGGVGQPLAGKLLLYDALAGRFSSIKLRGKAPGCAACGEGGMTREGVAAFDYAAFTGGQTANDGPPVPLAVLPAKQRLTAAQAAQLLQAAAADGTAREDDLPQQQQQQQQQQRNEGAKALVLLDVRPPEQFAVMSLPGAVSVPYLQLEQRLPEVLALCGASSAAAQQHDAAAAAGSISNGTSNSSSSQRVVVLCRRGNHSQLAVQRLRQAGVPAVDVVGGYEAWAAEVDSAMPVL